MRSSTFDERDLYKTDDPEEGLPADDYVRSACGLVRFDIKDELALNHDQASNRQFSEGFFLSCWQLYEGETLAMWKRYGPVAVCTRYGLLKSALNEILDCVHLGLVNYGDGWARRYNILEFIFSKRFKFEKEREVRAVLCCADPFAGGNRHFDDLNFPHREPLDKVNPMHEWVHQFKRRRVDVKSLVTKVVVGPWISDQHFEEVQLWARAKGLSCSVMRSSLTGDLTPTPDELSRFEK